MTTPKYSPETQARMVVLVNRYFTPYAVVLVLLGLALSQPQGYVGPLCIGLLVLTGLFNMATAAAAKSAGSMSRVVSQVRIYLNLGVNVVLVYVLGGFWTPIWLLFVLTPVATAVYGTRQRTIAVSSGVAALLIATYGVRRLYAPVDVGSAVVEGAFIVFISLFVNELVGILNDSRRAAA